MPGQTHGADPAFPTATAIASPPQPDPPLSAASFPILITPRLPPRRIRRHAGGGQCRRPPDPIFPLEITGDWQDGKARTRLLLAGPGAPGTILAAGSGSLLAVAESYHLVLAATAPPGLYTLLIQTRPAPDPCDAPRSAGEKLRCAAAKSRPRTFRSSEASRLRGNTPVTERILDIEVR